MLSKKLSMTFLLVAAALIPLTHTYHLTRDEKNPLDSYFLHDTLSSMLLLQSPEHSVGGREGNEINSDTFARPHNLKPVIDRRNSPQPIHTVSLTYHKAKGSADKDMWIGEIVIGKTTYKILFSTGSSDLWVTTGKPNKRYPDCRGKNTYIAVHNALEIHKDTKSDPRLHGSFQPQHGVEGLFKNFKTLPPRHMDTVVVGGITVKRHVFGTPSLSSATKSFCRLPFDGILGLAFPALAVNHDPFLFAALRQETSGFNSGLFALYLTKESGSELHIDGIGNTSLFDENDIEYHNILELEYEGIKPSYWVIGDGTIKVDGNTVASGISTIIDSGTDMIFGPMGSVTDIYAHIPHRSFSLIPPWRYYHVFPCNSKVEEFPKITFSWGANGKEWTIDLESFILSPDEEDFRGECRGAIQIFRSVWETEDSLRKHLEIELSTVPELMQSWVLGTSFLTCVYPIFDINRGRIGFAPRKQKSTRPKSPSSGPPQEQTKRKQPYNLTEPKPKRPKNHD